VPRIELTSHLARHVACPPEAVSGATVREALEAYFARHPAVRAYVLDEQGTLRRHVVIFVGETQAHDRKALTDPVLAEQTVYVMQALSGG
jgi:molybdopterin synthase sulfur carrier subunit